MSRDCILVSILAILITLGACSSDEWDDLPSSITQFIAEYYPGVGVKSYTHTDDDTYSVTLSNGVSFVFDSELQWTEADGHGSTLPQLFAENCLPQPLTAYLEATEQLGGIYAAVREPRVYRLTMLDTVLTYNISTGEITYPK